MSKILLVNTRPTRNGVELNLDPRVEAYFDSLEARGPKFGDTRTEPNNGLLILGHNLRHAGHQAEYLDLNMEDYEHFLQTGCFLSRAEMLERLAERARDCDFVFFSAIVVGIDETLWALDALKQRFPDKIMVLGGTFASLMPDYCLEHCQEVDALVIGEAEIISSVLIDAYQSGDFRRLASAEGVVFREERGRPYTWREGFNIVDLDVLGDLAMPDWSLLSGDPSRHVYRVMTSRGCGFRCKFCVPSHMSGHQVRHIDKEVILGALRRLKEEYQATSYVIGDLTFFFNPQRSREILRLIAQEDVGLPFWCQTHLTRVNRRNLELLREAGCRQMAVGVESINASILANINKGIDPREIVRKLLLIKEFGIETQTYFIVGLPGDNLDTIRLNCDFICYGIQQGFIDRTHMGVYVPYPGLPREEHITRESQEYRLYTQGVFRDIPATPVFSLAEIPREQVEEVFFESLGRVGQALRRSPMRSLEHLAPTSRHTIILGSEVVSLIHRLRQAAGPGSLKVVNVVQGLREDGVSFVSPHLQFMGDFVIGNLELSGEVRSEEIFRQLDGAADILLVDADQKSVHSAGFLRAARETVCKSKLLFYSDVQAWCRSVLSLIFHECAYDLNDKLIRMVPDNILARNLAGMLQLFGPRLEVGNGQRLDGHQQPCDVFVSCSLSGDKPGEAVLEQVKPHGVIIDAGIGSFQDRVYQIASRRGMFVLRPDMRIMIAAEIFQGLEYERFRKESFGVRRVEDDLTLVAGGVVGEQGSIVVDSAQRPRYIFGFANGKGHLLAQDELGGRERDLLVRAQDLLAAG